VHPQSGALRETIRFKHAMPGEGKLPHCTSWQSAFLIKEDMPRVFPLSPVPTACQNRGSTESRRGLCLAEEGRSGQRVEEERGMWSILSHMIYSRGSFPRWMAVHLGNMAYATAYVWRLVIYFPVLGQGEAVNLNQGPGPGFNGDQHCWSCVLMLQT